MNFPASIAGFDPTTGKTILILAIFFALSGSGIAIYERLKKVRDDNLRTRYYSWFMIAPVVLIPSFFGGLPFALLTLGLALYCLREFFDVVHVWQTAAFKWVGRISGTALIACAFVESTTAHNQLIHAIRSLDPSLAGAHQVLSNPGGPLDMPSILHGVHPFYVLPVFIIMLVLTVPVFLQRYEGMVKQEAFTILGILYFGWFLGHLVLLRNLEHGFGCVIFLSMAVVFNDVLAYTVGRLFGRTKLAPAISPKKTVEGALGGLMGSLLSASIFSYAVPDLSFPLVLLAALSIGVAAPLGDLIISVIKRDMAVKDSGTLIPGHGGLLDRCDSLIFATPVFYYFLRLMLNPHG